MMREEMSNKIFFNVPKLLFSSPRLCKNLVVERGKKVRGTHFMLRYLKIANDLNLCSLASAVNIFIWWMLHEKYAEEKKEKYLLDQQMQTSTQSLLFLKTNYTRWCTQNIIIISEKKNNNVSRDHTSCL